MTTNRQHQEAHGIGQIEEQLDAQAHAATDMQPPSEADRDVQSAANRDRSELDEILIEE